MTAAVAADTLGVLLAGGQSRRMGGGDKCLHLFGGKPLLSRVIGRARPQVAELILNANGDPARFADFRLQVAADAIPGFAGPLAGILTAMEWAAARSPGARWIASFATDTPFFPRELVTRLGAAVEADDADIVAARSGGRRQPVFALWPVRLAGELRRALESDGLRKVDAWQDRYRVVEVDFPTTPVDPFFNVNGPGDLVQAEGLLASGAAD
jgi:molybdopterin-guanine dinucleotide biosynthesis protein A